VSRRALGADGCPSGWVIVALRDGALDSVEVVGDLGEVLDEPYAAAAVDMPVGLVEGARDADVAARRLVPGRASSVFATPPKAVIDGVRDGTITDHAAATAAALAATGKGISMQAWRLVPKIVRIDELVASGHALSEVHPEVAFAVVTGELLPRKRSWSGITTRRAVLERLGVVLPDRFPGDESAAPDDVVDAAICAWVADGIAAGMPVVTVPPSTTQLAHGRPVVIVARPAPPVVPGPRRQAAERRP
jgi:predicted RNase H-like nuclease